MVGVLVVGFIANLLVRPVSPKFHERDDAGARTRTNAQGAH